jgi:hypothetical protein
MNSSFSTRLHQAIALLDSVYGTVSSNEFPKPMPADEAGMCADTVQRRYLWTDAFAVLAYVSIAELYESQQDYQTAQPYRRAIDKLISTVHDNLGKPRSNRPEHAMKPSSDSPTGFVGLRIGKEISRPVTDYGMRYDGQYWHYIDKWLWALQRAGHDEEAIAIARTCFPHFFDSRGKGMRWKLSVDATPAPGLEHVYGSNSDTLSALIVFCILQGDDGAILKEEIGMLQNALGGYKFRVTDDPLGFGLDLMWDQFLHGSPMQSALKPLASRALDPSHMSLPFRLYGAMIGARIAGWENQKVDALEEQALAYEARVAGHEKHSSINRVMLAMCLLCPGTLGRRTNDPMVKI